MHFWVAGEQRGCLGSLLLSSVVLVTHSRCLSDGDGRTEESSGVHERITPHRGSGVVPSRRAIRLRTGLGRSMICPTHCSVCNAREKLTVRNTRWSSACI